MKNASTILLSAGVLLVGFTLITPLLFFVIGLVVNNTSDTSIFLEMEYAFLSLIGMVFLILGSVFSGRFYLAIIIASVVAATAMVGSVLANYPKDTFGLVVIGCYYLSLLIALSVGIAILHTRQG